MENEQQIKALVWLDEANSATYAEFAGKVGDAMIADLFQAELIADVSLPAARTATYVVSRKGYIALGSHYHTKEAEWLHESPEVKALKAERNELLELIRVAEQTAVEISSITFEAARNPIIANSSVLNKETGEYVPASAAIHKASNMATELHIKLLTVLSDKK